MKKKKILILYLFLSNKKACPIAKVKEKVEYLTFRNTGSGSANNTNNNTVTSRSNNNINYNSGYSTKKYLFY